MKDINLFEGIKKSGPVKKSNQSVMAGLVLLIACAALVGGLYVWQSTEKNKIQTAIESANGQISTSQSMSGGDLSVKQNKLAAIRTYNAMLTAVEENIAAYPKLDAAFLKDLEGRLPSGVTVQTFGYKDGVLTMDCIAGSADASANFADALTKSEYINTVNLKGSQMDMETLLTAGTVQYHFTVECYLKGGGVQ